MRSEQLDLTKYRTDKVTNRYIRWYDSLLSDRFESVRAVLELGVHYGGSLELWRDYFPHATIIGIDADLSRLNCPDRSRIEVFEGSQTDTDLLRSIAARTAPQGFDLIVDDASHIASDAETSFWCLFDEHLKPGGLYVLEDWGTGYVQWADARPFRKPSRLSTIVDHVARRFRIVKPIRSHAYGMVGFVKQLIDEQGLPQRKSKFEEMIITQGLVAIRKV